MAQKIRILARNRADTATLSANPTAASSSLGESNLQRMTERERVFRTSSAPSGQVLQLIWGSSVTPPSINCVGLTRHNASTSATLHPRVYAAGSPSSLLVNVGAQAMFSTSGLDTEIDVYTESDFAMLRNTMLYFAAQTNPGELHLTVADASNADGYFQAHRLWTGRYWEFTYSPPFGGAELRLADMTTQSRADDATHLVDKRGKFRRLTLRLDFVPDTDLPTLLALCRYAGLDKEIFVDLYPDDTGVKRLYNMMAGRIVDSPITNPHQVGLHRNTLTIEET